jgi:endonuclease-3
VLIFHGRRICFARKPNCEGCGVNDVCPCAFEAEHVGRKGPRLRVAAEKTATKKTAKKTAAKPKAAKKTAKRAK